MVLPFTAVNILYLIVLSDYPNEEKLRTNPDYRNHYLTIVVLHIDKVK